MVLIVIITSCTNDRKSDKQSSVSFDENVIGKLDIPSCLSNCRREVKNVNISKGDIVVLDDCFGKSFISQISLCELKENDIVLLDREKLFCYSLPDGHLLGFVDAKGQGPEEYNSITAASISNDKRFHVLVSKWQSSHSEIKIYSMENEYVNSIQLPDFFGDLNCVDSTSYTLTGAVNTSGGFMPIVEYDLEKDVNLDTIFIGESIKPKTTFFQTRRLKRNQSDLYYFESGDTIYGMAPKKNTFPQPILYLDYKDLKFKISNNKPLHENKEGGILLTSLSLLNNSIYARFEWNNEIYYIIYDISNNCLKYNLKINNHAKEYGISFNIEGLTFCSWPISYWNGNLLFPIPDYIMSEIFNTESNPGLLKLSVERLLK